MGRSTSSSDRPYYWRARRPVATRSRGPAAAASSRAVSSGVLINLAAVGRASRPLADWWTRLLVSGEADVDELERARRLLEALPTQPGRLSRAVALVVSGGRDATQAETVAAVELLALAAARSRPITRVRSASRPRWRRPVSQPPLPGFK